MVDASLVLHSLDHLKCTAAQTRNATAVVTTVDPCVTIAEAGSKTLPTDITTQLRYDETSLNSAMAFAGSEIAGSYRMPPSLCFFDSDDRLSAQLFLARGNDASSLAKLATSDRRRSLAPALKKHRTTAKQRTPIFAKWTLDECLIEPTDAVDYCEHLDSIFGDGGIARRAAIGTWEKAQRRSVVLKHLDDALQFLFDVKLPIRCAIGNSAINQVSCGSIHQLFQKSNYLRIAFGRTTVQLAIDEIDDISITTVKTDSGSVRSIEIYDWRHHLVATLSPAANCRHLNYCWEVITDGWPTRHQN